MNPERNGQIAIEVNAGGFPIQPEKFGTIALHICGFEKTPEGTIWRGCYHPHDSSGNHHFSTLSGPGRPPLNKNDRQS